MRTRVHVCAVYTVLEIYSQHYQGNHVYCKTLQYVVYTHTYVHNWIDLLMNSDGLVLAQSWLRMVLNNEEWIWVLKGLTESQRALRWVCTDAKASRHSRCVYQRQVICAVSVSWLCICSCLGFKCFTACHPCIWCNMEHIFLLFLRSWCNGYALVGMKWKPAHNSLRIAGVKLARVCVWTEFNELQWLYCSSVIMCGPVHRSVCMAANQMCVYGLVDCVYTYVRTYIRGLMQCVS